MTTRVGDYLLFETLGKGAFGKVKAAVHEPSGTPYAVKIMQKSAIRNKELTQNVRREIAIMKALKHPSIVSLHHVLASPSKLYIVLDIVEGGELFQHMAAKGQGGFPEHVARRYFQHLIDGVAYCHSRGVCHRDLKPENLLLDQANNLRITDFGLSSMKGADTTSDLLTTMCGTPHYIAPEIISNNSNGYDGCKVDAWACGIILFALLAGYLPFDEEDIGQLFDVIQNGRVTFPTWITAGPRDLIWRLLSVDPDTRTSVQDVKQHPWFLVDYQGDTSPGVLHRRSRTPSRLRAKKRKIRLPKRQRSDANARAAPPPPRLDIPILSQRAPLSSLVRRNTSTISKDAARASAQELKRQQRGLSFSKNYSLLRRGVVNYGGIEICTRYNGIHSETLGGEHEARLRGVLSTNTSSSVSLSSAKLSNPPVSASGSDREVQNDVASDPEVEQSPKCEQQTKTIQAIRSLQTMIAVSNGGRLNSEETMKEDCIRSSFQRRLYDVTLAALRRLRGQLSEALEDAVDDADIANPEKRKSCASHMSKSQRRDMMRLLDVWETRMIHEGQFSEGQTECTAVSEEEMLAFMSLLRTWETQLAGEDFLVEEILIPGSVVVEEERPTDVPEQLRPQLPLNHEWRQDKQSRIASSVALPKQARNTPSTLSYHVDKIPGPVHGVPLVLGLANEGEVDEKNKLLMDFGVEKLDITLNNDLPSKSDTKDLTEAWGNVLIANKSTLDTEAEDGSQESIEAPVIPMDSTPVTLGPPISEERGMRPKANHREDIARPGTPRMDVVCSPIFTEYKPTLPTTPIGAGESIHMSTPKAVSEFAYSKTNTLYHNDGTVGNSHRHRPGQVIVSLSPNGSRPVTPREERGAPPPRSPARIFPETRELATVEDTVRNGKPPPRSPMRINARETSMSDLENSCEAPWQNAHVPRPTVLTPPAIESGRGEGHRGTQVGVDHGKGTGSRVVEKGSVRKAVEHRSESNLGRVMRKSEDQIRRIQGHRVENAVRAKTDIEGVVESSKKGGREKRRDRTSRRVVSQANEEGGRKGARRKVEGSRAGQRVPSKEEKLEKGGVRPNENECKNGVIGRSVDKSGARSSRKSSLLRRSVDRESRNYRAMRLMRGDGEVSCRDSSEVLEAPKKQRRIFRMKRYEEGFHSAYKVVRCEKKLGELLKNRGLRVESFGKDNGHKLRIVLVERDELVACLDLSGCDGGCLVQLGREGKKSRGRKADVAMGEFYRKVVREFSALEPGVAVRDCR